jgi:hypothetical protein
MNERIKQLAVQADNYAYKMNPEEDSYGRSANPRKFQQDRDTKFAELLIKECGQWFNNRLVVEPDHGLPHRIERNRAVVGVMKEYNTHFGVEE